MTFDWSNWIPLADQVLTFFLSLVPRILDMIMSSPLIAVPVISVFAVIFINLIQRFLSGIGSTSTGKED